jgi:hypothetical protein
MVFPFRAHQFRTEIKRLAPCWWFIYNHSVMVEAVLVCSISLLETLMGVFYTKVCTQRKYEKYQNGFGTWSLQSPCHHLNFVPKKIWFCSSVGKALVSQVFHSNFQHQITSVHEKLSSYKIREYHIDESHFEGISGQNTECWNLFFVRLLLDGMEWSNWDSNNQLLSINRENTGCYAMQKTNRRYLLSSLQYIRE